MANEKTKGEKLKEKLLSAPKSAFEAASAAELKKAKAFAADYIGFLNAAKTEREAVVESVRIAEATGFKAYAAGKKYKAGDRFYKINRDKAVMFAVKGKKPIADGVFFTIAHIDSPRLDLKQVPLYEDSELAFFKTHYYGGIKKYQWMTIPLSLHGVVVKKDGKKVTVRIGEEPGEPVFCITDILPHLGRDQMSKKVTEAFPAENLNVIIGSMPFADEKVGDKVKLNVMRLLNEKYGIVEDDFLSAELEIVPAVKASFVGFDESMIGSYGQDDRVCAYTALRAILEAKAPEHTLVCVLTDKEETGSDGNTGMQSDYVVNFVNELADAEGAPMYTVLANSKCLSADVNAAFDPNYPETMDRRNSAKLNYGVIITKYTGSGGKYGTSDASAEFLGYVRAFLDAGKVVWQTGNLGKVDGGGGGTIAKYIAERDVDTVDVGVPILSMHAPFELSSVNDVYMTYRAFAEFDRK